jgi:hypothetical protein
VERAVDLSMSEDEDWDAKAAQDLHLPIEKERESAPAPSQPPPQEETGKVMTWARSTLVLSVTLMAVDGHPDGRTALVGLRANNSIPQMRYCKERELRLNDVAIIRELFEDVQKGMEA